MTIARTTVDAPAGAPPVAKVDVAAAAPVAAAPSVPVVVVSIVAVAVVSIVAWRVNERWNPQPATLPAGISIFALFYVLAQAIERAIEPISMLVSKATGSDDAKAQRNTAVAALINANTPLAAQPAAVAAATAQATVAQHRANFTVGMWALASSLAVLLSAVTVAYFLQTLGVHGVADKRWLDIVLTGLTVGAGTKPLHDLVTRISDAKDQASDPKEAQ